MKIGSVIVPLDDLFKLDINNHNSLIGGFMGFAHAAISSLIMALTWFTVGVKTQNPVVAASIMITVWFLTNLWWYRKETKGFTISLLKPRSTPLVTLDTRLDFFNPFFWSSLILFFWFKSHGFI